MWKLPLLRDKRVKLRRFRIIVHYLRQTSLRCVRSLLKVILSIIISELIAAFYILLHVSGVLNVVWRFLFC